MCLIMCVASVWAPGSPFQLQAVFNSTIHDPFMDRNLTDVPIDDTIDTEIEMYTSIILLMAGITSARFG